MAASPSTDQRDTPASPAVRFRADVFDERTAELGAKTEDERSRLAKVDRATLHRYRTGKTVPLVSEAVRFADAIGLKATDLWDGLS
jgi:predicted transcriptional regulator